MGFPAVDEHVATPLCRVAAVGALERLQACVDGDVKSQFTHFVRQVFVAMQAMEDPLSVPQQHVSPVDKKTLSNNNFNTLHS